MKIGRFFCKHFRFGDVHLDAFQIVNWNFIIPLEGVSDSFNSEQD